MARVPALGGRHACAQRAASQPTPGERTGRLAADAVRLVVDDPRTDVTKTRKDGTRGRPRTDYRDAANSGRTGRSSPALRSSWG
jgi:hypothetical protein